MAEHSGAIFHFDGEAWAETSSLNDRTAIYALWSSGSGALWAVGAGGQILKGELP